MPAIASLEDSRAAQKKGVSINAMHHVLCALLYGNGAALGGKMSANSGWKKALHRNLKVRVDKERVTEISENIKWKFKGRPQISE